MSIFNLYVRDRIHAQATALTSLLLMLEVLAKIQANIEAEFGDLRDLDRFKEVSKERFSVAVDYDHALYEMRSHIDPIQRFIKEITSESARYPEAFHAIQKITVAFDTYISNITKKEPECQLGQLEKLITLSRTLYTI